MILLHNIGPRISSNYNTLDEILACNDHLSFDGIYSNVYENYRSLKGKSVTFFVMGKYVGGDNSFDIGQKHETYCTWDQIIEMSRELDAEIAYHSWSHKDLTKIESDEELYNEIVPPFPMKLFAYPHGVFNDRVIDMVKKCGYQDAYSVVQGNDGPYQRRRKYLNW